MTQPTLPARSPSDSSLLEPEQQMESSEITEFEDSSPPQRMQETPAEIAEILDDNSLGGYPGFPNPFKHPWECIKWIVRTGFSFGAIIALLAAIAAVPLASIFVLGYLLEAEARVARTGKLRYGFPLLHRGQRLATIVLGVGLWLIPVYLISGMATDARLIDPDSAAAAFWESAKVALVVFVSVHLCLALARGGSLGCFVRPLKNLFWFLAEVRNRPHRKLIRCGACGEPLMKSADACTLCGHPTIELAESTGPEPPPVLSYWERADRKVREFIGDFRVKHHFLLGIRGFVGAFLVLLIPTLMFAAARTSQGFPVFVTVVGGFCLAVVFLYVPFLQARLAAENRLTAMWELGTVRKLYRQAPIAWFIALLLVYVLTLPLFLLTAFLLPSDAMWLITPLFVMSIYPARVITGWAYSRATRKQQQGRKHAWFGFRWGCRLLMLSATAAYTLFFFFSRDIGSHGRLVLFEHHAFFGTVLSSVFSLLP